MEDNLVIYNLKYGENFRLTSKESGSLTKREHPTQGERPFPTPENNGAAVEGKGVLIWC